MNVPLIVEQEFKRSLEEYGQQLSHALMVRFGLTPSLPSEKRTWNGGTEVAILHGEGRPIASNSPHNHQHVHKAPRRRHARTIRHEQVRAPRALIERSERALQKELNKVFRSLAKSVAKQVRGLMAKVAKADSPKKQAKDVVEQITMDQFGDIVNVRTLNAYSEIAKQTANKAFALVGGPMNEDIVNQLNVRALAWAEDRAADLVGMSWDADGYLVENPNPKWSIEQSTRDSLQTTIANAIETGVSVDDLADQIEEDYSFSEVRSRMIARTETMFADNQGALEGYKHAADLGVTVMKVWQEGEEACEVCQDLADQDPIPLDDDWETIDGDLLDAPPAHPNCRCGIAPEVIEEEE